MCARLGFVSIATTEIQAIQTTFWKKLLRLVEWQSYVSNCPALPKSLPLEQAINRGKELSPILTV